MGEIKNKLKKIPMLYRFTLKIFTLYYNLSRGIEGYFLSKKSERIYKKLNQNKNFNVVPVFKKLFLTDWCQGAGTLDVYFWQDLWGARIVREISHQKHYDIGSRVDGFVGHLASFRNNIVLIDVRPLENTIPGVSFFQADATELGGIG